MNINKIDNYISEEKNKIISDFNSVDEEISKKIEKELSEKIMEHFNTIKEEFPYTFELEKYNNYNLKSLSMINIKNSLQDLIMINQKTRFPFDRFYWKRELSKLERGSNKLKSKEYEEEFILFERQILKEWKKNLDKLISDWELKNINKFRHSILNEYLKRLENLKKIKETLIKLGLGYGYLWDLSKGNLKDVDIDLLNQWISFLDSNKEIKDLCDILGRVRQYFDSSSREKIYKTCNIKSYIPDINSKEEISGIRLGNEIQHLIPSELSLIKDEDLSILFDLKFLENKLMCFDFHGQSEIMKETEIIEEVEVTKENKGPIILCIDTSGSMHGTPENVAKAISLTLSSQAISEERDCLLINFSTNIEVLEINKMDSIDTIFDFLKKSFYGGTDVLPALNYALEKIETDKYKDGDILIISDFILEDIPEEIKKNILKSKLNGNKFYSISIGDLFLNNRLRDIFDTQWVYNPRNTTIEIFKEINNNLLDIL